MTVWLFIFYLVIFVTVAIIIINTNSSGKALAYLMLISFFPLVGLIVYFAIGRNYRVNKLYNKKLEVDKKAFPGLGNRLQEYSDGTLSKYNLKLGHFLNLAKFNHLDYILTPNNQTQLLVNGEKKFPALLSSLKSAKHHIHFEYYIFEDDAIGEQIADVLCQKAIEGVEVRFIYDDFGSKAIRKSFVKKLKESGVEAFPFYKIQLLFFANRINYRNHRKIVVVDGELGYVGGINISGRYTNPNEHGLFWRDTHLKVSGPAVLSLQKVFMADWNFCAKQQLGVTKKYFPIADSIATDDGQLVQIISSGPDSDHPSILFAMIQAIVLAKKEILITTPYFVPDLAFLNAVKIARLSNVDVKILIPGKSDSVIVNAASQSYYQELLEIGVEIFKYKKGFVHAKTMVCDGFMATVGTANLDQRSFDLNFEINAFVYDETLASELREVYFKDLADAEKIDLEDWISRPSYIRFFERFTRLFAPLM